MTHGTIAAWHKKPGDSLSPGSLLCDVETDKASVGFEFQDEAVLAKILISAGGSEIPIGQTIAYLVADQSDYKAFLELPPSAYPTTVSAETPPAAPAVVPEPVPSTPSPIPHPNATLSPAARHLVESQSIDVSSLSGTSKGGRIITKEDVLNALKSGKATKIAHQPAAPPTPVPTPVAAAAPVTPAVSSPAPPVSSSSDIGGKYTDIPNNNMRKVIAKRLTESKLTVPHAYTLMECDISELLSLRNKLKKEANVTISVNDLVIRASALALRDVPECNGSWNKTTGTAQLNPSVDISVAVATPNGLITPIVQAVDTLGLSAINSKVKDLATRARDGKLLPHEYQGGTFTISNLGMFGISSFSAVINPPQACILAVGGGIQKVIPNEKNPNDLKITTTMTVQLSSDRRVVDEALAGQFLQAFRYYLSNPTLMML